MKLRPEDCPGLTTPQAGAILRDLAMNVPGDQAIVEIGVYLGRSLLYLADGAESGNGAAVYGVDPYDLPRPSKPKYSSVETYLAAKHNVQSWENITLLRAFSISAAKNWEMGYPKVGLLYIDADHRKLPVLEDFAAWRPHLAPGCAVTFDDCHTDFPGVIEAVNCLWQRRSITRPVMATDRLAVSTLL